MHTIQKRNELSMEEKIIKITSDKKINQEEKIELLLALIFDQKDLFNASDFILLSDSFLSDEEKALLCCEFGLAIAKKDRYQGISYINNARFFLDGKNKEILDKMIKYLLKLNEPKIALDLKVEDCLRDVPFPNQSGQPLLDEYENIKKHAREKQEHGHQLLIKYLEKDTQHYNGEKTFIEIGTTRENIPGQGSTLQLAKLCKEKGIKFITVDMDPHNTRWANFVSERLDLGFVAVNKKGEEFLKNDIESFDFIFLDAYDFDHGKHSEIRQQRYIQNLGSKIDDEKCHIMHLESAKSVVEKLRPNGMVCIDDTWQNKKGEWIAKGTLAVPYLLENGFKIIDKRNNAVLMVRTNES
jgi:hypothetical protein